MKKIKNPMLILWIGLIGQQAMGMEIFTGKSPLDGLPEDIRTIIGKYVLPHRTLQQRFKCVLQDGDNSDYRAKKIAKRLKEFCIASPKSSRSENVIRALLINVISLSYIDGSQLHVIAHNLNKIGIFKEENMRKWIGHQKEKLKNEEKLFFAMLGGKQEEVHKLIALPDAVLDINAQHQNGSTPLYIACTGGRRRIG